MAQDYTGIASNLIETFEGFRSKPYPDKGGKWTFGFGTTVLPNGEPVTQSTPEITIATARAYYMAATQSLAQQIQEETGVSLTAGQMAALIDFAYNLGIERLLESTLWRKLNDGDVAGAASEFIKWDHEVVAGRLVEEPGLRKRRLAETALFTRGY